MRYDMLVRENIGFGKIESLDDQDRIETRRAKEPGEKPDRPLSRTATTRWWARRFEGGVDLSGGEWQKLALARAYMRDAQLLILDEPTATLDARAEYEVFQRFAELTRGRMAVLISHRFSTVRMADRILVLAGRRDSGTGHARSNWSPSAAAMPSCSNLQAAGYR